MGFRYMWKKMRVANARSFSFNLISEILCSTHLENFYVRSQWNCEIKTLSLHTTMSAKIYGPGMISLYLPWKPPPNKSRMNEIAYTIFRSLELHHIKLYCIRSIFAQFSCIHTHFVISFVFFLLHGISAAGKNVFGSIKLRYIHIRNNLQKQFLSVWLCVSVGL